MELLFYNGFGGFDTKKGEYVIDGSRPTPMPWVNCITSPNMPFGFLISDSGGGFVWKENSQSGRITSWHCKPVQDPVNEWITVGEENGARWDCIPRKRQKGDRVRFGKGYCVFERDCFGSKGHFTGALTVYSGLAPPVKCSDLTLVSREDATVTLTYTVRLSGYRSGGIPVEPTGEGCKIGTDLFMWTSLPVCRVFGKGDRVSICVSLRLKENVPVSVQFYLGAKENPEGFASVVEYWEDLLGSIRVATPEPAVDVLMNGWLLYQVKACRLDGRSGYYQSGGAYGFRDQLQDVLAFLYTRPSWVRAQLLLHGSRQYEEGDVQHWWHPETGAGVRTQCSDDLLWLVYGTSEYIRATGDTEILKEILPFLRSEPLHFPEQDRYEVPETGEMASFGEHLRRAVWRAIRLGEHGLPLIGSCDWNDGMSQVGSQGKGESVWLSWFLQDNILRYIELSEIFAPERGDERKELREIQQKIQKATEECAWDSDRYLRAFCDDGMVLGGVSSPECSIDSISQSWSRISGCGEPERVKSALDTAVRQLADLNTGVVRLLAPSFSKLTSVGYIAAYPAGVRENGGQYTHGAIWLAKALLMQGDGERGYGVLRAINPIYHTRSEIDVCRYRGEPYVMSADVYSGVEGMAENGRAGWSWYTGSAAWYYRVVLEDLLGFRIFTKGRVKWVSFKPNLPENWNTFLLAYRFGDSVYEFHVERGANFQMQLTDDGKMHVVRVRKVNSEKI